MVRRVIFVALLAAGLLALGMMGFKKLAGLAKDSERSDTPPPPAMVRTQKAARGTYTEALTGYGRAQAVRSTTVSAELAGYVVDVHKGLEAGNAYEFVLPKPSNGSGNPKKEQPRPGPAVIQLETYELEDIIKRAEQERDAIHADIARLKAATTTIGERIGLSRTELATAKRERDRVEKLVRGEKLPPSQLDAEKLKVMVREQAIKLLTQTKTDNEKQQDVLAKRIEAAETGIKIAKRNLSHATVRVPFPGVIEMRHVNRGDRVGPGQALFTVLDLSKVEVPIALPARFYDDVQVGATVTLTHTDSGTLVHKGPVARKAPKIDEIERIFFIYVELEGTPTSNPIAPGTFLKATLDGRTHEDVVVVPREAFAGEDLFVIQEDKEAAEGATRQGVAERITPSVSRWLVDVAVVTAGVEDGQEIVTSNLESVANGTRLRIAPPTDETSEKPAR